MSEAGSWISNRTPGITTQETAMQEEHYAGIDVSLELASVCIVDANGKLVKETKVDSHPDALAALFNALRLPITRIGLEAGPPSQPLPSRRTSPPVANL